VGRDKRFEEEKQGKAITFDIQINKITNKNHGQDVVREIYLKMPREPQRQSGGRNDHSILFKS